MGIYDRDYSRDHYRDGPQVRFAMPALTPVVMWLLIINVAVYLASIMIPALGKLFTNMFSVFPVDLITIMQIWRLVTYQFLHNPTEIGHIFFNMLVLFFFGPMLERQWGSKKFLIFYLICGAMGGVLYTFLVLVRFPYVGIGTLVGASGAIYGVLASVAIMYPRMKIYVFGIFPIQMMYLVLILVVISLINIRTGYNAGGEAAHLAGMAAGAVYVLYRPWRKKLKSNSHRTTWKNKINQQRVFQDEVDRILDKINNSGIGSLTRKEKKILKEASQRQQNEKY